MPFEDGHPQIPPRPGIVMPSTHPVSVDIRKQETLRLLLEGYRAREIAVIIGVNYHTVLQYTRDPKWRAQAMELSASLVENLDKEMLANLRSKTEMVDELAMLALDEMRKLLESPNTHPGIKVKMIDSALDRSPELSRTKKVDLTSRSFSLKGEDLLAAAVAARELEERSTEVEVTEVQSEGSTT